MAALRNHREASQQCWNSVGSSVVKRKSVGGRHSVGSSAPAGQRSVLTVLRLAFEQRWKNVGAALETVDRAAPGPFCLRRGNCQNARRSCCFWCLCRKNDSRRVLQSCTVHSFGRLSRFVFFVIQNGPQRKGFVRRRFCDFQVSQPFSNFRNKKVRHYCT